MLNTVPNILTFARLLAAPLISLCFIVLPRPYADIAALALFAGASITDWLDGYLARKWNQQSRFGAMLDPIADKAAVAIALIVLIYASTTAFVLLIPATIILFREIFVSGLREFLGADAKTLKVTKLAKWKTTVQMAAICVLFAQNIFEHFFGMGSFGMDGATLEAVLNGQEEDYGGLIFLAYGMDISRILGVVMLWLAALLALMTGADYWRKARHFFVEAK